MNEGVIDAIAKHACDLGVLFMVICVGLAIVIRSFRKPQPGSTNNIEDEE